MKKERNKYADIEHAIVFNIITVIVDIFVVIFAVLMISFSIFDSKKY
jgi:hypothetical protein